MYVRTCLSFAANRYTPHLSELCSQQVHCSSEIQYLHSCRNEHRYVHSTTSVRAPRSCSLQLRHQPVMPRLESAPPTVHHLHGRRPCCIETNENCIVQCGVVYCGVVYSSAVYHHEPIQTPSCNTPARHTHRETLARSNSYLMDVADYSGLLPLSAEFQPLSRE